MNDLTNAPVRAGDYARLVYEARSGLGADVANASATIQKALDTSSTVFRAGALSGGVDAGALDITGIQSGQLIDVRVRATADAEKYGTWNAALASDGLLDPGTFLSLQGNIPLIAVAPDTPSAPPGLPSTTLAGSIKASAPPTVAGAIQSANTTLRLVAIAAIVVALAYGAYRILPTPSKAAP